MPFTGKVPIGKRIGRRIGRRNEFPIPICIVAVSFTVWKLFSRLFCQCLACVQQCWFVLLAACKNFPENSHLESKPYSSHFRGRLVVRFSKLFGIQTLDSKISKYSVEQSLCTVMEHHYARVLRKSGINNRVHSRNFLVGSPFLQEIFLHCSP